MITTVKGIVGDATHAALASELRKAFPDVSSVIDDKHVDALILHVWNNVDDTTSQKFLGVSKPDPFVISDLQNALYVQEPPDGKRYYVANAKHARLVNPTHSFTAHLPLVRVALADTDATAKTVQTAIGIVDWKDHLLQSVEQVANKYSGLLGYSPVRADVITPARSGGTRFGAIALYLGYKDASDTSPSFYVLESGTATGSSCMLFISPDMKPIPARKKWYQPTPFTDAEAHYTGDLIMNGDEPDVLHVHTFSDTMVPEVNVDVQYQQTPPTYIWPALLTAQAAARVGFISTKRGETMFETLFAGIGAVLPWDEYPH